MLLYHSSFIISSALNNSRFEVMYMFIHSQYVALSLWDRETEIMPAGLLLAPQNERSQCKKLELQRFCLFVFSSSFCFLLKRISS